MKQVGLSDSAVQGSIIQLLERETNDPHWEALAEDEKYDRYYEELSDLCKQLAVKYHRPEAWHALVYSIYNATSPFAQWLIAQPETVPLYVEMSQSARDARAGLALQALAMMLERCSHIDASNCASVLSRRVELKDAINRPLLSPPPLARTGPIDAQTRWKESMVIGAIQALGVCGEPRDIAGLQELARRYERERIDPTDKSGLDNRESFLWLIRGALSRINERASNTPSAHSRVQ